ncbi:MAG: septal ring lytic transglycosylase RlpA family protein [Saprospiraceae bacterium]
MRPVFLLFIALFNPFSMPVTQAKGEPEYGKATYYADKLQGRKTASGEVYDKHKFTCAHKTHPFGTMLRVTRVDNNESVLVKVTDRGPYHDGYVVDISRAAAEKIDLIKAGTARVKVEVVEDDSPNKPAANPTPESVTSTPAAADNADSKVMLKYQGGSTASANAAEPAATATANTQARLTATDAGVTSNLYKIEASPAAKTGFAVQVASLSYGTELLNELAGLMKKFPGKVLANQITDSSSNTVKFKLLVGPYTDKATAEQKQREIAGKGYKKCFVVSLSEL